MDKKLFSMFNLFLLFVFSGFLLLVFCTKRVDRFGMATIKASGITYSMGQTGISNAVPVTVKLERDFAIDRTEVTSGFFAAIMGNSPSFFKGDSSLPVENVTFVEAADFCNRRSVKDGLSPCYNPGSWVCDRSKNGYRLPTEAEWEYACRGGSSSTYFWGKNISPKYCWYKDNSKAMSHRVATIKPNKFGLYDMSGNVWEWCDDHYNPDRTKKAEGNWELGPKTLKGGSFSSSADLLGSAVRDGGDPLGKSNGVGFRCVKNL
jgi:formylglycine-generating enzyme required for sulfatase activity